MTDDTAVSAVGHLLSEGMALWSRHRVGGGIDLETRAIGLVTESLALADESGDRALRGVCRLNLAVMLLARYERVGSIEELDAATAYLDASLTLLPEDHEDVAHALSMSAMALCHRFQRSGDASHLSRAIELARTGVDVDGVGTNPRSVGRLSNLGNLLQLQYEMTEDEAVLDEAIAHGRRAAQLASADQRPLVMGALIGSLLQRVVRHEKGADVKEAVTVAREAVSALASMPGYPARAQVLGAVVATLRADYQFLGSRRSLAEAVLLQRENVDGLPSGSPDRAIHLNNLSELLRMRFEQLGSRADLDEAVEAARQARRSIGAARFAGVVAAADSMAQRALAGARLADGDRDGAVAAAEASVEAAREAGRLAGSTGRLARALVLEGNAFLVHHAATGDAAARERAVACFEQSVERLSDGDPTRGVLLGNAGLNRLNALPEDAGTEALDPVIEQLREAVAITGTDTADGAQCAANLSAALCRRYVASKEGADLDEVRSLWESLVDLDVAPPRQRVRIAGVAGEMLMLAQDYPGAAERYAAAVALLPMAAWRGADRTTMEAGLAESRHIACDAAASRLAADGGADEALLSWKPAAGCCGPGRSNCGRPPANCTGHQRTAAVGPRVGRTHGGHRLSARLSATGR